MAKKTPSALIKVGSLVSSLTELTFYVAYSSSYQILLVHQGFERTAHVFCLCICIYYIYICVMTMQVYVYIL